MTPLLALPLLLLAPGQEAPKAELIEVVKVYDDAPHNAFTDLIRHDGTWYLCFREGGSHVSPDGKARVLDSRDGREWSTSHFLSVGDRDIRDPKFALSPDGRPMLLFAAVGEKAGERVHESMVQAPPFAPHILPVGDPNFWLWRSITREGKLYAVGYHTKDPKRVRLYVSEDGSRFSPLVETLFDRGYPNEVGLCFEPDGTMLCLLRRDGEERSAQLGKASPPIKTGPGKTWASRSAARRCWPCPMADMSPGSVFMTGRSAPPSAGSTRSPAPWTSS